MGKFIIKLLLTGFVVIPSLMWYAGASFMSATVTAIVLALIAYIVGDQYILRATNNAIATMADVCLAIVVLWVIDDYIMNWDLDLNYLISIVLALGVVEAYFHRYLQKEVV
jgi:hypothetical protein